MTNHGMTESMAVRSIHRTAMDRRCTMWTVSDATVNGECPVENARGRQRQGQRARDGRDGPRRPRRRMGAVSRRVRSTRADWAATSTVPPPSSGSSLFPPRPTLPRAGSRWIQRLTPTARGVPLCTRVVETHDPWGSPRTLRRDLAEMFADRAGDVGVLVAGGVELIAGDPGGLRNHGGGRCRPDRGRRMRPCLSPASSLGWRVART